MHELAEFEERPQCLQSFDFVAAEDQLPQLPKLADALECVFADSAWGGRYLLEERSRTVSSSLGRLSTF